MHNKVPSEGSRRLKNATRMSGRKPDSHFKKKAMAVAITATILGGQAAMAQQTLEEVVVTGSRIKRTDLTAPSPVAVLDSSQIQISGTVNVEQLLNQMPQIIPGLTSTSNNPGNGEASVDLRGLGAQRTLVLMDGKRMVPTRSDGIVDINSMPTALIDRVEVMTGGASAIYGSDAVAGVVNFILKHDFEGMEVNAQYELTDQGDGDVYTANATFGTNFAGGKGNVTIYANYNKREPVFQGDRGFSTFALQDGTDTNGNPALVPGGSSGVPGTRFFLDALGGGFLPGGANSLTWDANGQSRGWFSPQDLYNYAPDNYLQLPQERLQFNMLSQFEINEHFTAYMDGMFVNHNTPQQLAPTPAFITTYDYAPFNYAVNPFLSAADKALFAQSEAQIDPFFGSNPANGILEYPLFFGRRMAEVGPRVSNDDFNVYRIVAGLKGAINETWDYDIYYSRGTVQWESTLKNDIDKGRFLQALNATGTAANPVCIDPSNGCVPMNIFAIGGISDAAADFIRLNLNSHAKYVQQVASATVTGSLPGLAPAGDIGLAGGIEYRQEEFAFTPDHNLEIGNILGFNTAQSTAGDYDVFEFFAETEIPLVKDAAFAKELSANGAFRISDYSTVGNTTTWKAGGEWVPMDGLRIRGGYNRAVRAPNIGELFLGQANGFPSYSDPCDPSNGFIASAADQTFCNNWGAPTGYSQPNGQVEGTFGGNPNLSEETADTWTVGAVWTPDFIPNGSLTVDYYSIEIKDAISVFGGGVENTIFGCFFSQDLTSEFCQHAGRGATGNISPVLALNDNVSVLRTDGIDISADYHFEPTDHNISIPGRVDLFFLTTYVLENGYQANASIPFYDCAGTFGSPCGGTLANTAIPQWTTNFRGTWSNGPWSVSLNWRWIDSVDDARIMRAKALGLDAAAVAAGIPVRSYDSQHYVDISAVYDLQEHVTLSGGIDNLFDNDPPIAGDQQTQANTDPSTYDVLGRTIWAGLKLKW